MSTSLRRQLASTLTCGWRLGCWCVADPPAEVREPRAPHILVEEPVLFWELKPEVRHDAAGAMGLTLKALESDDGSERRRFMREPPAAGSAVALPLGALAAGHHRRNAAIGGRRGSGRVSSSVSPSPAIVSAKQPFLASAPTFASVARAGLRRRLPPPAKGVQRSGLRG